MDRPPAPDKAGDDRPLLPDYLLFQLAAASDAASAGFHAVVRENGLRVPEYRALVCLHDEDGLMVTRLAELALMEQSRMTRVIVQMDKAGLVRRVGDPRDRRRVRIYLTRKGKTLARRMVARARAHEAEILGLLPAQNRAALKSLLAELLGVLPSHPRGTMPGPRPETQRSGPARETRHSVLDNMTGCGKTDPV